MEDYMVPPSCIPYDLGEMCKLKKYLYGLKLVPRSWLEKFTTVITSFGLCSCDHDSTLFVMITSHDRILLSSYVDDMIIIGDDVDAIDDLKLQLAKHFEMKDSNTLHYFLEIEVSYCSKCYRS